MKRQFYLMFMKTNGYSVIDRCLMVPCASDPIWLEHIGCWRICAETDTYHIIGCQMPSFQCSDTCEVLGVDTFPEGISELYRLGIGDCFIGYTGDEDQIKADYPELEGFDVIEYIIEGEAFSYEKQRFSYFRISGVDND